MSYAVSAMTSSGVVNVHSGSVAEIRAAIAEARKDGAHSVSLSRDGETISESDLDKLTAALVSSDGTTTRYA